ncbi:(2Fe-2S)-binding protein [Herbaspirillum autotrophicum]|uniref:(2Fe-2S)-binding protein n=1 Tax=Herbaspirillum autotrophicum TaxID=180195 RepID=UPI0009F8B78C|nr:(2Fe-2S)-binding protein [Herbaspirillum autotrophicum]
MIVCVCNNISEGKIHRAVDAGMTTMTELRKELGIGTSCGKCHTCAKHVLRECLHNNTTRNAAQPMVFHAMVA